MIKLTINLKRNIWQKPVKKEFKRKNHSLLAREEKKMATTSAINKHQ